MLVIGVSMTFQSFQNICNLILDMEIIITSDYEEAKGELKFYDILIGDELCTRIKINNIKFDGGNVQEETLIEGNNYHVTYLPHTKYVVDYKSIP